MCNSIVSLVICCKSIRRLNIKSKVNIFCRNVHTVLSCKCRFYVCSTCQMVNANDSQSHWTDHAVRHYESETSCLTHAMQTPPRNRTYNLSGIMNQSSIKKDNHSCHPIEEATYAYEQTNHRVQNNDHRNAYVYAPTFGDTQNQQGPIFRATTSVDKSDALRAKGNG